MKLPWITMIAIVGLAGCQSVPENVNRGELVASAGVRAMFEDPGIDAVEAGERVRCERYRRVGTHLIQRVCMTMEEWELKERHTQEEVRDLYETSPCINVQVGRATGGSAPGSCGEGRGR